MANIQGPTFAKSSPHSSDEASHHDTPSTNLTGFTLDSASTATGPRPKFDIVIADVDGFRPKGNVNTSSNDPFVHVPTPTSERSQLSPTADDFTPGQFNVPSGSSSYATNNNASNSAGVSNQATANGFPITHGRARYGAVGDHPQLGNLNQGLRSLQLNEKLANEQPSQAFHEANLHYGTFTTDEPLTRAFMVTDLPWHADFHAVARQFSAYGRASVTVATNIYDGSRFLMVKYSDYQDAQAALANAPPNRPGSRLTRLLPKAYADIIHAECPEFGATTGTGVSNHEGEIKLSVFFDGRDKTLKAKPIFDMLQQKLSTFGAVKAFSTMPCNQGNVREIRVEYYDIFHAEAALRSFHMAPLGPLMVSADYYEPDLRQGYLRSSITGRSTVPFNDPAAAFAFPGGPYSSVAGNGRGEQSGLHNQVELIRIQRGLDVRTTIMLRNIPNKVTSAMLKMILDETSRGQYDFMYLRIDFANNCNVGYAFINFIDASAIIPFALARAGQRWNRFASDKVAEISYATIQGRDCLVQKFRNSSVMLEHPTFRPKLYVTGHGPDAGEEEPFPPPDNPSKMRRSVENAGSIGLFRRSNHNGTTHNGTTHNGTIHHGTIHHGTIHHGTIHNGTSHNGTSHNGTSHNDTSHKFITHTCTAHQCSNKYKKFRKHEPSNCLFGPKEGQKYREQQRRRHSLWDRGTTGAEVEAQNQGFSNAAITTHQPLLSSFMTYPAAAYHMSHINFHNDAHVATPANVAGPSIAGPSNWYHHDY